ncbi:hypothetical protein RCO28_16955 [Streptomyces sp. LHD-70]|uniref:hypothetical protein n=1 Tax=Streptomyces sp. LHD-70 TaxID=3072140 RepID=UPI00280E0C99|nr:hypothetical protein [Streptomyces sp. LHD-70]MDQ8704163.1 hypothetical protein [Streptomyces sp. LHD-70]
MARHAASRRPAHRTLMRAGLTLAAAGAALGAGGAATASAQPLPAAAPAAPPAQLPVPLGDLDVLAAGQALTGALPYATGPLKNLQLDPLAKTGVDPLDNAVGTQVADFQPVSTAAVTDPVTEGGTLGTLPVVGTATGLLPG